MSPWVQIPPPPQSAQEPKRAGAPERFRRPSCKLRSKLQQKGTKSAKRRAKKHAGKEARQARDTNHKIAQRIVAEAQRTGSGMALEDLTGIRDRARLKKPQRVTLHCWAFRQLGEFIAYKAKRARSSSGGRRPGVHQPRMLAMPSHRST
ncbi:IS200/IS605 family accessory protein TnpB-related protein [Streptomyces sp. NPDC049541]|uniref:IS200/IS605 family accessory protein TnpB-related protein n=1 Tax=Streptomyces sp. NPDC049541 TaxID=3365594 RepID=UPI003794C4DB